MIAVIAARADAAIAGRVFARVRDLRQRTDAEPDQRHDFEWQVIGQLESVFRRLRDHVAAASVIASVTSGDPLDIKVASSLLSRVARPEVEPVHLADEDLKARLRAYLKEHVELMLHQDDFNGVEKANLASSIAQAGEPEDVVDLVALIRGDIERKRRGWAAHVAGDRGPRGSGCIMSYAHWHIAALVYLDPAGADRVLTDLIREPEYRTAAAEAMARDYVPKPERPFDMAVRYDLMWAARECRATPSTDDERRKRCAAALKSEIKRLRNRSEDVRSAAGLGDLAKALATVDGRGSAAAVLDAIEVLGQWDEYERVDAAERLLMAGVVLPTSVVCALADSVLERTAKWMQDSDKHLVHRTLALCPFVDDPAAGIAKVSEALRTRRIRGYELRELVTPLGESRSDAALDLLHELASDSPTFNRCEESLVNAFAALGTRRARELLLGFVDPDIGGSSLTSRPRFEDVLVARLGELAQRSPATAARLRQLCERDLPELNRHLLSRVMEWIGTPETTAASLNLIDDANPVPIPEGTWHQLESAFVERRSYGHHPHVFIRRARTSNELRARLFRLALHDPKRRESASMILGKIEEWRLEHGRPAGEPRHPISHRVSLGHRRSLHKRSEPVWSRGRGRRLRRNNGIKYLYRRRRRRLRGNDPAGRLGSADLRVDGRNRRRPSSMEDRQMTPTEIVVDRRHFRDEPATRLDGGLERRLTADRREGNADLTEMRQSEHGDRSATRHGSAIERWLGMGCHHPKGENTTPWMKRAAGLLLLLIGASSIATAEVHPIVGSGK